MTTPIIAAHSSHPAVLAFAGSPLRRNDQTTANLVANSPAIIHPSGSLGLNGDWFMPPILPRAGFGDTEQGVDLVAA